MSQLSPESDSRRHVVLGAGPLGQSIATELARRGANVTVVTRSGTAVDGAGAVAADLSDAAAAKSAVRDADVVYQCTQPPYHRWVEEFPRLQSAVLAGCEAAGAVLVAAENLYGYGPVSGAMTEDLPMAATTRKGVVRAAMWQQLQNAHTQERVRATAGRAADFFGPGVTTSAFGERFFGPLINGKKAEVMGPLPNRHSVTYVRDFARALIELGSDSRAWGRAWHVPNNPALRIGDLVKLAAQAAGTEPASSVITAMKLRIAGKFVPAAKETIEMLYQFQSDFVVDHTPFAQNFTTAATPLPEAIAATVEWYREPARQSG